MRRRLILAIVRFCYRRPWLVCVGLFVLTAISTFYAKRLRKDFDWTGFLPAQSEAVAANQRIHRDYPDGFDVILVALRTEAPGQQKLLIEAARKMAHDFMAKDPSFIKAVEFEIDEDTLRFFRRFDDSRMLALLDEAEWAEIEDALKVQTLDRRLAAAPPRTVTPVTLGKKRPRDPLGVLPMLERDLAPQFELSLLPLHEGYAISGDGRILLMAVKPAGSSSDILFSHAATRYLEECGKSALKDLKPPARKTVFMSLAGPHVEATRAVQHIQHDLRYILYFGVLLTLALFVVVFRKVEAIFYIILPVGFAIDWTLGVAGLLYKDVNVATLLFVFVTIGVCFEFTLHVYNRFIDELYRSLDYPGALEAAFVTAGRGITISALTGALVFASLRLTPYASLKELGTVAALSVLCGLFATLLVMPTAIAIKARFRRGRVRPVQLPALGLDKIAAMIAGHPRATLILGFLLTSYLAYWAQGLRFGEPPEPEIPDFNMNTDYFCPFPESLPTPDHPILALLTGGDLQQTLERNDRLYRNLLPLLSDYSLPSVDSLRRILPSIKTQREFRERMKAMDLDAFTGELDAAGERHGYTKLAFAPLMAVLGSARALPLDGQFLEWDPAREMPAGTINEAAGAGTARTPGQESPQSAAAMTIEPSETALTIELPETGGTHPFAAAVRRYLRYDPGAPDGRYSIVTAIYPSTHSFKDARELRMFLIRAGQGVRGLRFTGDALLKSDLSGGVGLWLARSALLAACMVFIAMIIHFHSVWKAVGALVPVFVIALWTFGAMALLGMRLHFYSLILLPLVVILAVDHNLHFLQRYSERGDMWAALTVTGRAMLTTSVALMLFLGPMAYAKYEGLRNMGQVMIFGNAFALFGSLTLLPAYVRLRELGAGFKGILEPDRGLEDLGEER